MAEFFVVCPLGFEDDLARELREIEGFLLGPGNLPTATGYEALEVQKGGVLIKADPLLGLQLHFFLRLASRILLRVARFRTTEFSLLERELKKLDPAQWIGPQKFSLKVSSQKSKLGQEKRIFETAQRAWKQLAPLAEQATQQFFLRAEHDEFELSIDLTGEHLHKRGSGRDLGGLAPIRETLAAALLRFLIVDSPLSVLQKTVLVDPMAGSGTLISEAAHLYRPLFKRPFAFQSQKWIPKILTSPSYSQNYRGLPALTWAGFVAMDESEAARERLETLKREVPEPLTCQDPQADVELGAGPVWVVSNPPYGERLKKMATPDLVKILLKANPERVAVILPESLALDLAKMWTQKGADNGNHWVFSKQRVLNGGIPCLFVKFVKDF
ncbi:MAG: hypothetical protein ACK5P7_03850 [Bdellovibrio sp.]